MSSIRSARIGILILLVFYSLGPLQAQVVPFTTSHITVDGAGIEKAWSTSNWIPLTHLWAGTSTTPTDFNGRVKYLSDANHLYVLAEIEDDTLIDIHPDPKDHYWDDDCLEIFIDADASGGIHQYDHSAFAYHISLDGHSLDMGTDQKPLLLDKHVLQKRSCAGTKCVWEVRFNLYQNNYKQGAVNPPLTLKPGSKMRIASAYCDNDHSAEREHFYGSMPIPGKDKNRAWIDASLFPVYRIK